MLLSFLIIPYMVNYLGPKDYGVWVTLVSVIGWVTFFDLGMGNGMRNKVAEALAHNNHERARSYIATTYFVVLLLAAGILGAVGLGANYVDWQLVLNTQTPSNASLKWAFLITAIFSLAAFVLAVTNSVINACQKSAYIEFNQLVTNASIFLLVGLLLKYAGPSLVYLSLVSGACAVSAALLTGWLFYRMHRELVPTWDFIDRHKINELVSLGGRFFLIQLAYLVIFMSDNMIIAQVLGPDQVTGYSVIYKLFSVITLVNGLLTANLWSAYTEAYAKGDVEWISATLKKVMLLLIPITFAAAALGIWAQDIVRIWLARDLQVSSSLVLFMAVYVVVSIWCQIFSYFLNGVGAAINIQVAMSLFSAAINIPLSIYLARGLHMGSAGVILGTVLTLLPFAFVGPLLALRILRRRHTAETR